MFAVAVIGLHGVYAFTLFETTYRSSDAHNLYFDIHVTYEWV